MQNPKWLYMHFNNRAELVTLAPGLCPERRFVPLARSGNIFLSILHLMRIASKSWENALFADEKKSKYKGYQYLYKIFES